MSDETTTEEWIVEPPAAPTPALIATMAEPEDEDDDGDDKPAAPATPATTEEDEDEGTTPLRRMRRSVGQCKALVRDIDDETITTLLLALAKEAHSRGIDPVPVVTAATPPTTATGRPANRLDLWGRIITRVDRTKRGGFRFDGTPIYGRAIIGRDLSSLGVSEGDGNAAPVLFGRKDMRGTLWLALPAKGKSLDMDGTTVVGMELVIKSSTADEFEKLSDTAEALLAGVSASKIEDRRTAEKKLAELDDWE